MSEVFEGYERQYCEESASLSRKCTAASALDGEKKKQRLSEIQSGVQEAESLIRRMDLEARNMPPSVKAGLLAKLREYKSDLNNLKSELKRISAPNARQTTREELLESGMADTLAVSTDQRGRLMMTTERLNQSTDRIKESRRTMLETEELGVSILQDLHQQRQSLLHAHDTIPMRVLALEFGRESPHSSAGRGDKSTTTSTPHLNSPFLHLASCTPRACAQVEEVQRAGTAWYCRRRALATCCRWPWTRDGRVPGTATRAAGKTRGAAAGCVGGWWTSSTRARPAPAAGGPAPQRPRARAGAHSPGCRPGTQWCRRRRHARDAGHGCGDAN